MTTADLLVHNADLVVTMDEAPGDLPGGRGVRDLLGPVGSDCRLCDGAAPVRGGTGAR
ncbi:hypothetical protein [Streptomyces sp. NBC_01320]|uniref:hypothetical protein n=1 Tax=Streptomyces sp. NBC_01320 TaxID=2903824 RepID=UPI002E0EEE26|nr:hypothetical protein OG395_13580 [Streptomyces sp. NBC_01320]